MPSKAADLRPGLELQPHQQRVRDRSQSGDDRMLLYHAVGTGKSLGALAAAEAAGQSYLAAMPASLRPNFRKEQAKFTDQSTPSEVLSYTALGQGRQPAVSPKTLILDEAHNLRNPNTAQAKAVTALAAQANRVLMLSGTPIVNAPGDLASPLNILTGTDFTPGSFEKRYMGEAQEPRGFLGWLRGDEPKKVPAIRHEHELEGLLRGHVDYEGPRLPEGVHVHDQVVHVDLGEDQDRFNRYLYGKLPWMLRFKMRHQYPLTDSDLSHLKSFFVGSREAGLSLLPFGQDPTQAFASSTKLQTAGQHLLHRLEDPRAKALVFSNFLDAGLKPYDSFLTRHSIPHATFHGGLTDEQRRQVVADYNTGKLRALLMGPSAAEGISTKGTSLVQILDPSWNETRAQQARGRALRFDSHDGLPPELKDVAVERYLAHGRQPGFVSRFLGGTQMPTADEILTRMSARKEETNNLFRQLLQRIGSEKTGESYLDKWIPAGDSPFLGLEGFAHAYKAPDLADSVADAARVILPVGVIGATGLYGLHRLRRCARRRLAKQADTSPTWVDQLSTAATDAGRAVYSQMPRLRIPDTVIGGGLGALGGLAYDAVAGGPPDRNHDRRWGRVLLGASAGAALGNLVGDRARRYVSNTVTPFGYESSQHESLRPRDLRHVMDAAVLDRPAYGPVSSNLQAWAGPQNLGWLAKVIPPRRELLRRQLGVHTDNSATDWFRAAPGNVLTINESNPKAVDLIPSLLSTRDGEMPSKAFDNPKWLLDLINKGRKPEALGLMGDSILGGQEIPHRTDTAGNVHARILDRFDYTLDPAESRFLTTNWRKIFNSAWRDAPAKSVGGHSSNTGRTNGEVTGQLLSRLFADQVLVHRNPWVSQRLLFQPTGQSTSPYVLQPLTESGFPLGQPLRKSGSVIDRLKHVKTLSDRKDYGAKHRALREILRERPGEFRIDSRQGGFVGLTHDSGFKIHFPARYLPEGVLPMPDEKKTEKAAGGALLRASAVTAGLRRPVPKVRKEGPQHLVRPVTAGEPSPVAILDELIAIRRFRQKRRPTPENWSDVPAAVAGRIKQGEGPVPGKPAVAVPSVKSPLAAGSDFYSAIHSQFGKPQRLPAAGVNPENYAWHDLLRQPLAKPVPNSRMEPVLGSLFDRWDMQRDSGQPSSMGSSIPAMNRLTQATRNQQPEMAALAARLHGPEPRTALVAAARRRGYPVGQITPASYDLAGRTWQGAPPEWSAWETSGLAPGSVAAYELSGGRVAVEPVAQSNLFQWPPASSLFRLPFTVDPLAALHHELEHAKQFGRTPAEITPHRVDISEAAASLGDIPYTAEMFRRHTGQPLSVPVKVAPGVTHSADWMARQGAQHGLFNGRSMTDLLATPSGQSYLQRLLRAQVPATATAPVGQDKESGVSSDPLAALEALAARRRSRRVDSWQAVPSAVVGRIKQGEEGPLTAVQRALGGPSALTNALVYGTMGAGVGHLGGLLAENVAGAVLPPGSVQKGRGRRMGTMLGAALGGLAWPAYRWSIANRAPGSPTAGKPLESLTTPWPWRFEDMVAPAEKAGAVQDSTNALSVWLDQAVPAPDVPDSVLKVADAMGLGETGALFTPSIPVDAFNNAVWNDVHATPNPFGTRSPWGDNEQPMGTPPDVAAAASGAVAAAGSLRGRTHVSPWDVALIAGAAGGKGYLGGLVLGKTIGALAGLSPEAQQQARQIGLWGGLLTGAVRGIFGQ